MPKLWLSALALGLVTLVTSLAVAHGMRSAYLEITETAPGHALLRLSAKVPSHGLSVVAPAGCVLSESRLECDGPLAGRRIGVTGMGPLISETALYFTPADGAPQSSLLTLEAPECALGAPSAIHVAERYLGLGWVHIWTGGDHLLFLLGLVLVLKRWRAVLLAESAFTLSHSISFSAAALGWVHVSASAAEACIALSLVLVALDVGRQQPSARHGALVAFSFGLVHGLGFAGGLSEIGLPQSAILPALAGFAGGVELGQVTFLAGAVGTYALLGRITLRRWVDTGGAYVVGGIGSFWLFERLARSLLGSP
jgi:hypothetical protein